MFCFQVLTTFSSLDWAMTVIAWGLGFSGSGALELGFGFRWHCAGMGTRFEALLAFASLLI